VFAVIFTSTLSADSDGYEEAAAAIERRCRRQPGFVGIDSVRAADGRGITVCRWDSLEAIAAWREDAEHAAARAQGRDRWYERYQVTVCEVLDPADAAKHDAGSSA
jgi:heme-degrading monooxygenase HmoA